MRKIKCLCLSLTVIMVLCLLPAGVGAAVSNLIKNGTFETLNAQNMPSDWTLKGGTWDENAGLDENANNGENALRFYGNDASVYVTQEIRGIVGGTDYAFSGYVKVKNVVKTGAMVKLEWRSYDEDGARTVLNSKQKAYASATGNRYEKVELDVTAPEEANAVNVLIRLVGGGDISWDDVELLGEIAEVKAPDLVTLAATMPEIPAENVLEPMEGEEELVINGGYEALHPDGRPEKWEKIYKGDWAGDGLVSWEGNPYISLSKDVVHSGENALKITTQTKGNPWCVQQIDGLTPGAIYQLSAWINSVDADQIGFKFEFYTGSDLKAGSAYGSKNTDRYINTGGGWKQICETVTIPDDTETVLLYARMFSNGTAFYDDVSFYKVAESPRFYADSDEVFYYSDLTGLGKVNVRKNLTYYPEEANATYTVDFSLSDGGKTLYSETGLFTAEYLNFNFDLSVLIEKQKAYTAAVSVRDEADAQVYENAWSVYRYDRPTMMTKEGEFIVDGEVFAPIYVYHAKTKEYPDVAAMGITLVQGSGGKDIDAMETQLDAAHEAGLKVMLPLYSNMKAAGHPDKVELTTNIITRLKDHPAVFAWMIQDEPHLYQETNKHLEASYKLIRELDPVHPCFIMENKEYYFDQTYKYTDIMGIDVYPKGNYPAKYVAEHAKLALEASSYRKPVYTLLQCYTHGSWTPTNDDVRNMIYQALFVGSSAVGYYAMDAEPFSDYVDTLTAFYEKEAVDIYDYFIHKKHPRFAQYQDEDVWYTSFVKDSSVYYVVANRSDENEHSTVIDLISDDGSVQIGAYTAELIAGGAETTVSGNGQLSVTLSPSAALVYKVTPSVSVSLVPEVAGVFVDSIDVTWAENEIEKLYSLGVINSKTDVSYGPQQKITRGDFAMFLVRALGLTAEDSGNFDDVRVSMPYAKEVAIGKALGILQGRGDGKFYPEEEISRQDLMVICARGMRLVRGIDGGDLSAFTDAELVADYAVLDIAAMVRANIVLGNADGTINPRGNTTRAEAAVIMSRIMDWAANP